MFTIIGEAVSNLSEATLARYPDVSWDNIRGMPNFAMHEYRKVEPDIVWETLRKHVPVLIHELSRETGRARPSDGREIGL